MADHRIDSEGRKVHCTRGVNKVSSMDLWPTPSGVSFWSAIGDPLCLFSLSFSLPLSYICLCHYIFLYLSITFYVCLSPPACLSAWSQLSLYLSSSGSSATNQSVNQSCGTESRLNFPDGVMTLVPLNWFCRQYEEEHLLRMMCLIQCVVVVAALTTNDFLTWPSSDGDNGHGSGGGGGGCFSDLTVRQLHFSSDFTVDLVSHSSNSSSSDRSPIDNRWMPSTDRKSRQKMSLSLSLCMCLSLSPSLRLSHFFRLHCLTLYSSFSSSLSLRFVSYFP